MIYFFFAWRFIAIPCASIAHIREDCAVVRQSMRRSEESNYTNVGGVLIGSLRRSLSPRSRTKPQPRSSLPVASPLTGLTADSPKPTASPSRPATSPSATSPLADKVHLRWPTTANDAAAIAVTAYDAAAIAVTASESSPVPDIPHVLFERDSPILRGKSRKAWPQIDSTSTAVADAVRAPQARPPGPAGASASTADAAVSSTTASVKASFPARKRTIHVDAQRSTKSSKHEWTAEAWIASHGFAAVFADLLLDLASAPSERDELAAMRLLGAQCDEAALARRLQQANIAEVLAAHVAPALHLLRQAPAASIAEAHDKFATDEKSFTLKFSSLTEFFGGLEAKIGPPNPQVEKAMRMEHTLCADATVPFSTSNYHMQTSSADEYFFVTRPSAPPIHGWAVEARISDDSHRRKPMGLDEMASRLAEQNARLAATGASDTRSCGLLRSCDRGCRNC